MKDNDEHFELLLFSKNVLLKKQSKKVVFYITYFRTNYFSFSKILLSCFALSMHHRFSVPGQYSLVSPTHTTPNTKMTAQKNDLFSFTVSVLSQANNISRNSLYSRITVVIAQQW